MVLSSEGLALLEGQGELFFSFSEAVFMPSREAASDMSSEVEAFSDDLTPSPVYAIILRG